jgi:hypothetical protein
VTTSWLANYVKNAEEWLRRGSPEKALESAAYVAESK